MGRFSGWTPEALAKSKRLQRLQDHYRDARWPLQIGSWIANPPIVGEANANDKPLHPRIPTLREVANVELNYPLLGQCKAAGLPVPRTEFRFAPPRRWRFDYAWPDAKFALEQDGGVWSGGRHVTGSGRIADMEKFNEAAILGWRILYCTPQDVRKGNALDLVRRALA